jgi:hypothetical protein
MSDRAPESVTRNLTHIFGVRVGASAPRVKGKPIHPSGDVSRIEEITDHRFGHGYVIMRGDREISWHLHRADAETYQAGLRFQ